MDESDQQPAALAPPVKNEAVAPAARGLDWLREGARVLAFRAPRWERLDGKPATVAVLLLAWYALAFSLQRALIDGAAAPDWSGFLKGWAVIAGIAWASWIVARSSDRRDAPSPGTLLALYAASRLLLLALTASVMLVLTAVLGEGEAWDGRLQWAVWLLPLAWSALATMRLFMRIAGSAPARLAAFYLPPLALFVGAWFQSAVFWSSVPDADEPKYTGLPLTEDVVAAQPQLLAEALSALRPPQPGRVNVYVATYAPYASQDVFMRESAVVARTMKQRFGAEGRSVELVLNPSTGATLPWATPSNLRKTIAGMAAAMDREHDILFLHLTSHGGADGKLAADSWPLQTEPLTPELLKQWLDEAGVRWRVISVSACYSGSWIDPLAGDDTLVMTAADATHTSYGCGSRSRLTFFGRAMYEDALQGTWSFAQAHAEARKLIETREREAGKSDGYSNPQFSAGAGIRPLLERLERQQQQRKDP